MLHNTTDWQATLFQSIDGANQVAQMLLVKQSFEFDQLGVVNALRPSLPIVMADEYQGDEKHSPLRLANELVPYKQGFEVYGEFMSYPPKDKIARVVEVTLGLQHKENTLWRKTLRVTGERYWRRSLLGLVASDPKPIDCLALDYSLAFGGGEQDNLHQYNPLGRGFQLKNKQANGCLLPQIEYHDQVLRKPSHTTAVAGFSPIPVHWQPRLEFQPKVNQETVVDLHSPYIDPVDPRYYNSAPQDQITHKTFSADWQLQLCGFLPQCEYGKNLVIDIPFCEPQVHLADEQQLTRISLTCDTLVIDTNNMQFSLLWRGNIKQELQTASAQLVLREEGKNAHLSSAH